MTVLNETEYNALPDNAKAIFEAGDDGNYKLKEPDSKPDTKNDNGELKRALDRERQQRKDLQKMVDDFKKKDDDDSVLDAKKKGDIELLEKSWASKMDKLKQEADAALKAKNSFIQKQLVDSVANEVARSVSKDHFAIVLPHVKQRLQADLEADVPTTRVLDADGNISSMSIGDLEKEFLANPVFAPIITASKATGGNGVPSKQRNGVTFDSSEPVDLSTIDPKQLGQMIKSKVDSQT